MSEVDSPRSFSEAFLDELLPEDLEWESVVRTYPLCSLALAAMGGFYIGRRSGRAIVNAFGESAAERVTTLAGEVLGSDIE
jgi:hypothetical protein